MSFENVRKLLRDNNLEERIVEFEKSSETVELAAENIGCSTSQIAKTITFYNKDGNAILIVLNGDYKVDNKKFKEYFKMKPKMIKREEVEILTSHAPGGVCPFAVNENAKVYLDISLKENGEIYPAGGYINSVVKLSIEELEKLSSFIEWIEIGKK